MPLFTFEGEIPPLCPGAERLALKAHEFLIPIKNQDS